MDIKEFLIKELNKREELTQPFKEKVLVEETTVLDNSNGQIVIDKNTVMEYLMKSGYELTQANYDMAEQMLMSMETDKLKNTLNNAGKVPEDRRYKIINHLYDMSVEELQSLLNVALLNALNSISNNTSISKIKRYEYAVEVIKDFAGGTNVIKLNGVLKEYANKGYRVVSVFTNELGKNAVSVGGIGINSTDDQVVVIFEKPIYE